MLLTPGDSRPGTSSKPEVETTSRNPVSEPIAEDIEIITISSSEDEMDDQDQRAKSSRPPTANNRMVVDPRRPIVTEMKNARPSTSIAPRQTFPLQPTISPNIPITGYTTQGVGPAPPLRNGQQHLQVQIPTPIHVHHTQNTSPNHATIDLRNLMTRSTYMGFPGPLPGSEAPQSQLPPFQPPTIRRPLQVPYHQGPVLPGPVLLGPVTPSPVTTSPVAPGFHHHRLPPSRDQQNYSNPPINPSRPEISHISPARPPIPVETRPPATGPLQPQAPSVPSPPPPPPPPSSRAHPPAASIPPEPQSSWQPVYIGKAMQLETTNPRFGVPPNEVPPPFLDRLKKLAGTRDKFPRMAKFLDEQGFYFCPWCEKRYRRPVKFTDHLVLNHSR